MTNMMVMMIVVMMVTNPFVVLVIRRLSRRLSQHVLDEIFSIFFGFVLLRRKTWRFKKFYRLPSITSSKFWKLFHQKVRCIAWVCLRNPAQAGSLEEVNNVQPQFVDAMRYLLSLSPKQNEDVLRIVQPEIIELNNNWSGSWIKRMIWQSKAWITCG